MDGNRRVRARLNAYDLGCLALAALGFLFAVGLIVSATVTERRSAAHDAAVKRHVVLALTEAHPSATSTNPSPSATPDPLIPTATMPAAMYVYETGGTPVPEGITFLLPEFTANVPMPRSRNFDAAQLDFGRLTYAQRCATCHGDRGQGLDAWRSFWAPGKQNCTASKCHGRQHPDDGFLMLKIAPPLMGPGTLDKFPTAFSLFVYVKAQMPFHVPGSLTDKEYYAVTAYLADQHDSSTARAGLLLTDRNAAEVWLGKASGG